MRVGAITVSVYRYLPIPLCSIRGSRVAARHGRLALEGLLEKAKTEERRRKKENGRTTTKERTEVINLVSPSLVSSCLADHRPCIQAHGNTRVQPWICGLILLALLHL